MRRVTVGFLGLFGPCGLATIVFVLILMEETELPGRPLMLTVVTWTAALSVYAYGPTRAAFERAAHLAASETDRQFLTQQIQELAEDAALTQEPGESTGSTNETSAR